MGETQAGKRFGGRRKGERRALGLAALCCIALPLLARNKLTTRVSVDLATQASEALGLPIELGTASVGLTGTLEIRDVRVGEFFRARRVIASITPSATRSRGLAANELLVDEPVLDLSIDRNGHTNLDEMLALRRQKTSSPGDSSARTSSQSRLRTLRFSNGTLNVNVADKGEVHSRGINVWMRGKNVHAVFGRTDVALRDGEFRATGTVPRAAFDYRRGYGLHRLLADGGAVSVKGPKGRAVLQELMLSAGVDGDHYQLSARTGIERATGTIKLDAERTLAGVNFGATLVDAPLALLAPWIPDNMDPRMTHASGAIAISAGKSTRDPITLALRDLSLKGLDVLEPALSRRELKLDLTVNASASLRRTEVGPLVQASITSLRSGNLDVAGEVSGQWKPGRLLPELAHIALDLGKVRCDAALSSLPAGLRPSLAGLELRGAMSSRLVLNLARSRSADTNLEVESGIEGCKVAAEPPAADTKALAGDYEHRTPDGRTRILDRSNPNFVAYRKMPKYLPKTFVAAEDARFFDHHGFDPHQIERSIAIDMENGQLLRGGSTISQQLVKNLFLNRRRSLARKLQEAVLTWRLEQNLSKKRILEVYLNIIELGDGHTYGLAEASERWFGIDPEDLSILQTAFLAALTPEPTSMSARIREAGKLDAVSAGRVATILRVMRRAKVISSSEYRKAKSEELVLRSQGVQQQTASK